MSRCHVRKVSGIALAAALLVPFLPARSEDAAPPAAKDAGLAALEETAVALHRSLTPAQRGKAVLSFDSPDRNEIKFPGGPRAGIPLRELTDEQRALAIKLLAGFASEYGTKKCEAVAAQDPGGMDKHYLAFFGEPGGDKPHAWRIAEHHCTLVHVEVGPGRGIVVGPVLLGANPPTLWNEEEDAMMALYAALTPEERRKAGREGKATSSDPIGDAGVKVGDLGPAAQEKAKAVFENRLAFFTPAIQGRIRALVDRQGGPAAMRVAFWGEATKRCADGGCWDFKLGGPAFLCDYENTRKHIHLSMQGTVEAAEGGK